MSDEWGPWIEHDGKPVPHLAGLWAEIVNKFSSERIEKEERRIITGMGRSWDWSNSPRFAPVIRYRVRKPRGLTVLENLIADQPQLAEADA
jgi:hypothetical protein